MTFKEQLVAEIETMTEEQIAELLIMVKNMKTKPEIKRRFPVVNMVGKAKTLGDIVSPIVDEKDWECLK
ncbi:MULTISPECIES: hypothetical protein [Sphaerospermopsis]|jgi:hypothetical protein|uniref:Uncharacterized protein n=2 Tax=Sphaerospermopsis TaxID=752201 RepID=A0A480A2F4_9CYAN|nr:MULTISPECIES: hypothetical protein [Sphaerospermopsis]MBD2131973.1 hypothetical protein [Sphaerospermopsis sp. FACHB-1094]MBD2146783.1 hypothetical protein [Sphaerospermopsis sp. FACHB-1194]MBE9236320.1 hypothetical protein [Sphaerospermopsis aphanizomenoides LEGE 00250]GCL39037.1 hypothetical protein SR1949_41580 [Sphaerospermopsis reniformis]